MVVRDLHKKLGGWGCAALLLLVSLFSLTPCVETLCPWWFSAIAALLCLVIPGYLIGTWFTKDISSGATRELLSAFLGLACGMFTLFLLEKIPGPLTKEQILSTQLLIMCGLFFFRTHLCAPSIEVEGENSKVLGFSLLAVTLLALITRTTYLNEAEFQGDEARALHMGAGVLFGVDDILYFHKKGPAEILLPTGMVALTGTLNEGAARFPCAISGVGIAMFGFLLALSLFGERFVVGALMVGLLLSIEGFLLAFSRIVQYQTPLIAWTLAALLLALEFRRTGTVRYLYGAAILSAAALFAHYDAVVLLPALAFAACAPREGESMSACLKRSYKIGGPLLLGAAILLSFYLPFFTHEHFLKTREYLSTRIGSRSFPYDNLAGYVSLLSFYNATFISYALALGVCCGAFIALYSLSSRAKYIGVGALVLGIIGELVSPLLFGWKDFNSAVLFFGIPILMVLLSLGSSFKVRLLALLTGIPLLVYGFFSFRPNTHFYTLHIGGILIACWVAVSLVRCFGAQTFRVAASIVLGGLFLVGSWYSYLLFIRQTPEYFHSFPKGRPEIFRAGFGDKRPKGAYFGYPHRSGWQAIHVLYKNGTLKGSYASNEEMLITGWYLRGIERKETDPDNYLIVQNPNDPVKVRRGDIERGYYFNGRIYVDGERRLDIYTKGERKGEPQRYSLEELLKNYRMETLAPYPLTPLVGEGIPVISVP